MGRFADDTISLQKESGRKIDRWEEIINPDGERVMRPIYAKE